MTKKKCSQHGCQIELSGHCLEGFDPADVRCPYYAQPEQTNYDSDSYNSQEFTDLPSGEALSEREAAEVTRSARTNVVIIAGPYGSGKTTILTSLYEAFLEAPFANFSFRGSRTLVGFERRSHLGREEAGLDVADTSHTSLREGVVFLHLDLALSTDDGIRSTNLLLSDISGELFRRLRDSSDAVREMTVLRRADVICLVLDGEKIVDVEQRHVARNDSRSILRSILESKSLAKDCTIDVAFTKWDVVVQALSADKSGELKIFIDDTKIALQRVARDNELRFHEVAARPPKEAAVPFAHGLPTLLRSWMRQNLPPEKSVLYYGASRSRESLRFTEAMIASSQLRDVYDIRSI